MKEIIVNGDEVETEVPACDTCHDDGLVVTVVDGIERVGLCDCRRYLVISDLLTAVPRLFRNVRFAGGKLTIEGAVKTRADECETEWVSDPIKSVAAGRGITYRGPEGTGKTTRAAALTRMYIEVAWRARPAVVFVNEPELISRTYPGHEEGYADYLTQVDLLVIDDFGKAKPTEYSEMTIYDIIDRRYREMRPIIVTTNLDQDLYFDKYPNTGPQILSRLAEMNGQVKLVGEDFRRS